MKREYGPPGVWDTYYAELIGKNDDLNPYGYWVPNIRPFLEEHKVKRVLDLGCGTGGDCLALAGLGYQATGLDHAETAITKARAKAVANRVKVLFCSGDMAKPLPFPAACFDAVMSNVALHSLPNKTLKNVVLEVARVLIPDGLFIFHVNSVEDKEYRQKKYPIRKKLDDNFYLETSGKTMHFFSATYCRDLLKDWHILDLRDIRLVDANNKVFKCVLRCVAKKRCSGSVNGAN